MERRELLASVGAFLSVPSGRTARGTQASESGTILGVFPGARPWSRSTFEPFEQWLGRKHAVIVLYFDAADVSRLGERVIRDRLTTVYEAGHVPMVTWQPFLSSSGTPEPTVERRIAAGEHDQLLDRWVQLLDGWLHGGGDDSGTHSHERRAYFRPFPEMNGSWLPWSASDSTSTTEDFVAAWTRFHDRFDRAGVTNRQLQWVWNPNATESAGPKTEWYYPGDEYVDWIGLDGYNFGDSRRWSRWRSPDEVFSPMLDRMRRLADKPIAFPEFGTTSLRDGAHALDAKAEWITAAFEFVRREGIEMACWFNIDKETDWAVFGGARGTVTYSEGGTTYDAYGAYRDAVTDDGFVSSRPQSERVLTHGAFLGSP